MPETRTAKRTRFTGTTVDELRAELNRWAEEIAETFETGTLITSGVQFVPVRGPIKRSEATLGLLFLRAYEYDLASNTALYIVEPHTSLTKALIYLESGTATLDGDGNSVAGGLNP